MTFPGIFPMTFFKSAAAVVSIVSSIQYVSIALAGGAATNTATISSVDTTRAIVIYDGVFSDSTTDGPHALGRFDLTNATTVTFTRGTTTGALTGKAAVIEFASGATTSVQQGTILLDNATSNTATISSVTTTRAAVFCQGVSGIGTSTTEGNYLSNVELTDGTTVTAARNGSLSTADTTVGYVVVEFAASYIQSVQHVSLTYTTATSTDATISAVTTANCWLAWGGFLSSTTDPECWKRIKLAGATTVTAQSNSASTGIYKCVIIEFVSGVINSNQRFELAVPDSVTSTTQTISSINTSKTIVNYTGYDTEGDDPSEASISVELTDATTVTARKGATGSVSSDDGTVNIEIIEFV